MVDDTVFQAQSEQAINKILKTQQLLLHKLVPNSTKLMLTHSSNSRGHIWFVVIKPTICLNADISFDFCHGKRIEVYCSETCVFLIYSQEELALQCFSRSKTYPSTQLHRWWPIRSSHSWSQTPHIWQSSKSVT